MRNHTRVFGKFGFAVAGLTAAGLFAASSAHAVTNLLTCTFAPGQAITATGKLGCVDAKLTVKVGSGTADPLQFGKTPLTCNEANANVLLDPYLSPFGFTKIVAGSPVTNPTVITGVIMKGVLKGYGRCDLATPSPQAYLPSGNVTFTYFGTDATHPAPVKLPAKSTAWAIIGGDLLPFPQAALVGVVTKGIGVGAGVTTAGKIPTTANAVDPAHPVNDGCNGIVTCSLGACAAPIAPCTAVPTVTEIDLVTGGVAPFPSNTFKLDLPL